MGRLPETYNDPNRIPNDTVLLVSLLLILSLPNVCTAPLYRLYVYLNAQNGFSALLSIFTVLAWIIKNMK